ncbi:MAG: YcxB family protein [Bacteroidales bacterium]|nr:YcxB family protein [Bacteroidales bacterium]
MKIAYNLTVADWVNFQEFYRRKKTPLIGCLEPMIYVLTALNVVVGTWHFISYGPSIYTAICLICIGVLLFLIYAQRKSKKNLYSAGQAVADKNPDAFGSMTIDLEESGLHVVSQNNTKDLSWADIDTYDSNKDYFFLYSKKGYVYIIPTKDISSETELKAILDQYLSKD